MARRIAHRVLGLPSLVLTARPVEPRLTDPSLRDLTLIKRGHGHRARETCHMRCTPDPPPGRTSQTANAVSDRPCSPARGCTARPTASAPVRSSPRSDRQHKLWERQSAGGDEGSGRPRQSVPRARKQRSARPALRVLGPRCVDPWPVCTPPFDPEPRAQRGADGSQKARGGHGNRSISRRAEATVGPSLRSGFWVHDGLISRPVSLEPRGAGSTMS